MLVERNIYHYPERLIHPYHLRISIKKQRFFGCYTTLDEARSERRKIITSIDNGRFGVGGMPSGEQTKRPSD